MRELRTSKRNDDTLARCLRQDLVKNIFNTSDPRLYRECFHGTKKLIEDYHNEIILCIKQVYESKLTKANKLLFFDETLISYGHTALLLSGGASFGKFHCGLIKALYEQDLLPRIICGSSAGSILAAVMCSMPYDQLHRTFNYDGSYPMPVLEYKVNGALACLMSMIQGKTIFKTSTLNSFLNHFLKDITFKEVFDLYQWKLNITVTDF